jgi:hypothetical protein
LRTIDVDERKPDINAHARSQSAVPAKGSEFLSTATRQAALWLVAAGLALAACATESAPTPMPTRTPHPPLVIPTRLNASERLAIFNKGIDAQLQAAFDFRAERVGKADE